ncbi:MAG: response regulator [bacterium]|nr:response regulator [bacterium]
MADNETKILICDDSILARKSLKEILNSFNYEDIVEVADGQTVIDTYKILKPDIVFLDIVMPVKDGITAVKEIIQFDSKACIIMVSSVGTQTHLKEAIKSGAKDFIQKPVDPEQLKQILNHCIGD